MRPYLSSLFCFTFALLLYSCSEYTASPVRNVRFDPNLLNRAQLTNGTPTTYFFLKNNIKQYLGTVHTKQILVTFSSELSSAEQQELVNNLGFVKALGRPYSSGSAVFHSLELIDGLNSAQVEQALVELQKRPEITYAAPYFQTKSGLTGVSNELKVQLNSKEQLKELEGMLNNTNASVVKQLNENTYLVQVDKNSKGNALELANFLSGQKSIAVAEPTFLTAAL